MRDTAAVACFRGPAIRSVQHRCVLSVDVNLISVEVALQSLGDFGVEVTETQSRRTLFCARPSLADILTVKYFVELRMSLWSMAM